MRHRPPVVRLTSYPVLPRVPLPANRARLPFCLRSQRHHHHIIMTAPHLTRSRRCHASETATKVPRCARDHVTRTMGMPQPSSACCQTAQARWSSRRRTSQRHLLLASAIAGYVFQSCVHRLTISRMRAPSSRRYTVAYWVMWKTVETIGDQRLLFGDSKNQPVVVSRSRRHATCM